MVLYLEVVIDHTGHVSSQDLVKLEIWIYMFCSPFHKITFLSELFYFQFKLIYISETII